MGAVQNIEINSIFGANREPSSGSDQAALNANIKKEGLRRPVLITGEGVIIDGTRRVRAMKAAGKKTVPAYVATNYPQMVEHLRRFDDTEDLAIPMTGRLLDMWYQINQIRIMGNTWLAGERGRIALGVAKKDRKRYLPLGISWRADFYEKTGVSESQMSQLFVAHRILYEDPVVPGHEGVITRLKTGFESGEMGPTKIIYRYRRLQAGTLVKASEQKQTMETTLRTLTGAVHALKSLGPWSEDHSPSQLASWLKGLEAIRTDLYLPYRSLRRRINNEQ